MNPLQVNGKSKAFIIVIIIILFIFPLLETYFVHFWAVQFPVWAGTELALEAMPSYTVQQQSASQKHFTLFTRRLLFLKVMGKEASGKVSFMSHLCNGIKVPVIAATVKLTECAMGQNLTNWF